MNVVRDVALWVVGIALIAIVVDAAVQIWGAKGKAALRKLGIVKSDAKGAFAFKAKSGDVFQASAIAAPTAAPPCCGSCAR